MDKSIKISIRITQEQYNFITETFGTNISEAIRFAIKMLEILLERGFYCKIMECPNIEKEGMVNDRQGETENTSNNQGS